MDFIDELRKDSRLKGVEVNQKNAVLLSRFLDELDNCDNCSGVENCPNMFQGMKPYLEDGEIKRRQCPLMQNKLNLSSLDNCFPTNYIKDATFDDFHLTDEAKAKALAYARSFISGKEEKGLYIVGEFATGKTYFLSALANELALGGKEVIMVFVPELSRDLKASIYDHNLTNKIDSLKDCDVLILDDLGGEMNSPWFRDEVLAPIINHRLLNKKAIFISSNLNYEQLDKHFKGEDKDNDGVKANRILERIKQMTKRVKFSKE